MMVLITYDVSTTDSAGRRRLRQVAKACQAYGQRVQHSVFECIVDAAQFTALKIKLLETYDGKEDSLRFYRLGNKYKSQVEHYGVKPSLDLEGPLIF